MVAILEKTEHNTDFYQIVDFLKASHIRYALTICPTVYVSHIRQFWSTTRIETTNQETKIIATVDGKSRAISESSLRRHLKLSDEEGISSLPDAELFENFSLMGYNILPNQSNIATAVVYLATNRVYNFSKMIFDGMVRNINNEPASRSRDDRQGEPFPTVSSLDAGQDRENIAKTSALPHKSSPRVTSLDADEGSMQHRIHELMELCTILQRQQSHIVAKIEAQDLEISELKARVKSLEDKSRRNKSTELGRNDTEEMVNVLSSIEAANILTSGGAAASVSPAEVLPAASVPTVSGSFPTVSAIFTTASMRLSEQLARDSEIARLHAEEELNIMIEGLDKSNEVIAKHLQEYEQAEADLSVGEKLELINELVKYQDRRAKILKYQAQQSKPLSKKEQRDFYMSVLRSHVRWKTKHFRGMTMEQLKEKFTPVWKQFEDFVPMNSKKENKELWTLVKETFNIKQATKDKEKELWVELKRLFEPNFEDQLWTHNQAFMHDPLEWKLYDTSGVHHVSTKDQEIFMLVEKDYPLRKGLATVMINPTLGNNSSGDGYTFFINLKQILLGVGATIRDGVYILVRTIAKEQTRPAITISFLIAGIAIGVAWLIDWYLILEYSLGGAAVARGISLNMVRLI
nr:hypothetical protein [Tanacetum cinerariifolium]